MATKDLILAIDNGTQSVRALIFDLQGNMLARSRMVLEAYFSDQPGWAEQKPEYFWEQLAAACQGLWAQEGGQALRERIAGVALTTQGGAMINLDEKLKPLRPVITWLDQRRTTGLKPVGGLWGAAFRLSGMSETVAYLQAEAEANWIAKHQPELWARTHKYVFLSGYLTYRLTGNLVDSVGCQVGYMPFDYQKQAWAGSFDWKWQALPVRPEMLIDLVPPTGVLGEIGAEAARATGIPEGLPLLAAALDKACEILGSGCVEPQIGCISYGTQATLNTLSSRYIEPIPLIPPFPSAIPKGYMLSMQVNRGFWMVSWFKQEFGHHEMRVAEERGVVPEVLFDELVNQVPPGSMGLTLQPYWSPGIKIPGPEAKGAIVGFGDVHTRAHFYRAILEGLAYALREGQLRLDRRTGQPITSLRVSGGGSQSDAAMQITADIFGLPAARPHLYETTGLGAAMDAAVGLKLHADFGAAVAEMTHLGRVFEPNPVAQKTYAELFEQVYRQMYPRLRPLYDRIRAITGYPPR